MWIGRHREGIVTRRISCHRLRQVGPRFLLVCGNGLPDNVLSHALGIPHVLPPLERAPHGDPTLHGERLSVIGEPGRLPDLAGEAFRLPSADNWEHRNTARTTHSQASRL